MNLVFHTTFVACVDFKVESERQIFEKPFYGKYIYSEICLPEICWEKIAEEIHSVFRFDVWLEHWLYVQ